MTQSTRETERKYEVPASGDFPRLSGLTGARNGMSLVDAGAHDLDAVYYDTADLRLSRTAATLRRRTGGSDAGWHLKLPLSGDTREEIRAPLQEEIPDHLRDLALSRTRGARLEPVVRIRSHRAVRDLVDADGSLLAEVVLDHVEADSLRPEGGHTAWVELEVELADNGDPALLKRVDKALGKEGFARVDTPSKLTRALKETTPDGQSAPDRSADVAAGSAGEQVLAYVLEQVRTLVDLDPAVRRGLPDSVHKMRVAARRLRSCLRSYRPLLDREVTDPIREELKWLGGELGGERDQEVLAERVRAAMEELPRELVLGPAAARLQAWDANKSAAARERSLAALSSPRYVALLESLNGLTTHPPLRSQASRKPTKALPKAILKEYDRLAGRIERARRKPPGPERDAALHHARKGAKRLRYAAEAARPALGKPAKRLGKHVKAVQKTLGDHHDSVVARDTLRRQAVAAHAAGEPGFTWGLLHGQEQATATERERQLAELWRRASRPRLRRALRS